MFIYVTLGVKKKCCSSVLSVCQHDLAIQSVSTPSYAMGRDAGRHNQENAGSHAAPSRGCRMLGIADNPAAVSTEPALLLT